MFSGSEIVEQLTRMGITHVVWLPDSALGTWEAALDAAPGLELIRVCREGEAWAVAAGLSLAGSQPLVMIQCTGLFESGDSLRNFIHDYGIPLFAVIGYRSYLIENSPDSAKTYTEPMLRAFELPYRLISRPEQLPLLSEFYASCQAARQPGVVLLAEGRM
jgi:sulfopyruvate decarboxylase TPP-binding subunit